MEEFGQRRLDIGYLLLYPDPVLAYTVGYQALLSGNQVLRCRRTWPAPAAGVVMVTGNIG